MSNRRQISKNGGKILGVSKIFFNSRQRMKYRGAPGELVADVCACEGENGEMVAKLYLFTGNCDLCGGTPVAAEVCEATPNNGGDGDGSGGGDSRAICDILDDIPEVPGDDPNVPLP